MITKALAGVFAIVAFAAHGVAGDWNSIGRYSSSRTITVHLKNGRQVKGTIQTVEPDSLQLAAAVRRAKLDKTGNAFRIPRNDIQKITWKSRGLGALIGLGMGAGAGVATGAGVNLLGDTGVKRAQSAGVGGVLFGLAGAVLGGAIGVQRTVYEAPGPR
jgi:hypothetical protein